MVGKGLQLRAGIVGQLQFKYVIILATDRTKVVYTIRISVLHSASLSVPQVAHPQNGDDSAHRVQSSEGGKGRRPSPCHPSRQPCTGPRLASSVGERVDQIKIAWGLLTVSQQHFGN